MFVHSFKIKNSNDDPIRNSFDKYYMALIEIKDFNALISNIPLFDKSVKNKQEPYTKLIYKNDDNTTANLLHYLHHQKYYKVIGIDLSRQTNTNIPQQINFVEKLEEDDGAAIFFLPEKQQKNDSKFFLRLINCNRII